MILDSLSPETELRQATLQWASQRHPLARLRALRDAWSAEAEAALWQETAALGWHDVLVPEALGGPGGTLAQAATLAEVQGECLFALPWAGHAVHAVGLLLACPPSPARDAALRAAATRRLTVIGSHWDAVAPPTVQIRPAGEHLTLQGDCGPVPGAGQAAQGLVLARAGDGAGTDLLCLVDAGAPGVQRDDGPGLDGRRAAALRLRGAMPVAVLVQGHAARAAWEAGGDAALLAGCAEACGLARLALRLTLEHLRTRQQFGQPLARFQALQHRAADMAVACAYANAHTWGLIARHEAGAPHVSLAADAAAARVEVLRNARQVVEQAVQLHGGLGVSDEGATSHAFKRIVALEAALGERHAHLERVAGATLSAQG